MATEKEDAPARKDRWRAEALVPGLAAAAVAVTALVAALTAERVEAPMPVQAADQAAVNPANVVQAPPLKSAPESGNKAQVAVSPNATRNASAMGAGAACRNCGVVEMVVAVHGYGEPKASGYQMHIRMDDGTTRTVEQRGALAAGSRVVVDGASVRPLAAPRPGQG